MRQTSSVSRDEEVPGAGHSLKVALFTGNYNCIVDGVTRTLHRIVAYLEERGHSVLAFGSKPRGPAIPHPGTFVPVPAMPLPGRGEYLLNFGLLPGVRARLAEFEPDIIHIATPDLLGHGALAWARRRNLPAVASFHTHFSSYLRYYGVRRLEPLIWRSLRRFYARCDQVYVPSRSMIAELRSRGFAGDLRLWSRGVDTAVFSPAHRSLRWRRSCGIGDEEVVLTYVSRVVKEKGLDALAAAIEELQSRGVAHRSLIVGEGPERRRLAARLGQTLFTGHLEGEELSRAYASSDVFVFPSDTETFGNVTLEALASGLPAVCVPATGSSSLFEDGVHGFLVPSGSLAEPLERLLSEPELRRSMGAAARRHAMGFGWDETLRRLEGFYEEALD